MAVLDLAGRRLAETMPGENVTEELDTSGLPPGIYVLEIALEGRAIRKRFVKQ